MQENNATNPSEKNESKKEKKQKEPVWLNQKIVRQNLSESEASEIKELFKEFDG